MTSKRDLPPKFSDAKGGMRFAFPPYVTYLKYRLIADMFGQLKGDFTGMGSSATPKEEAHHTKFSRSRGELGGRDRGLLRNVNKSP
jgi:hypothetical protein